MTAPRSWLAAVAFAVACGGGSAGGPRHATLDPGRTTALALTAVGGATTFCPNAAPVQLHAVVTVEGGSTLETWVDGQSQEGRLGFDAFAFTASAGEVVDGKLVLPSDPFALIDRKLEITARVTGKPAVEAKLSLTPEWNCGGSAEMTGAAGEPGARGGDGVPGREGRSADSVTKAENGEPGEKGLDGSAGRPGGPGPTIDVALGRIVTQTHGELVLVRTSLRSYLFDPAGGPLGGQFSIVARGGDGGAGGAGGTGGNGGDGGDTSAEGGLGGNGADGAPGGGGGRGGDGGPGGTIRIQFDSRHPELMQAVKLDNGGGKPGARGPAGKAGRGGRGGVSVTGQRGTDGRRGQPGQRGAAGSAGAAGPAVDARPADATSLFAGEIQRGVTISPK